MIVKESLERCKVCGIPDFMAVKFFPISKDEGYCELHIPEDKDPQTKLRQLFDKFFEKK